MPDVRLTDAETEALTCMCDGVYTSTCCAHGEETWVEVEAVDLVARVERILAARLEAS